MALAASPARGADEPFPLDPRSAAAPQSERSAEQPATPTSDYIYYASVSVNGREQLRMVKLRERDGNLLIARASLAYLRLIGPPGDDEFVALASVVGVRAQMDWQRYHLDLAAQLLDNPDNTVDFRPKAVTTDTRSSPLTAVIVDYDLSAGAGPAGLSFAGQVNARVARGNVALASSWTFATGGTGNGIVRLDTALRIDDPAHLRSLTVGDFVQASAGDARAVRMGGIQLSSNFALRPDFIAYPLPDFSGNLAVPQQLDLIVNDRRHAAQDLQAGSFSLNNVPVSAGRGRIGVVIKDSLGREQYVRLDYYASRSLLDPGVSQWSIALGRVRHRYGQASDDYGPLAASFALRRGITRQLTLGLAGEGGNGLVNFGTEGSVTLGALAEVSGGFRASRLVQPGISRSGEALTFNLASVGRGTSLRLSGRKVLSGYDDLASAGGDAPPTSFIALALDFNLGKLGGVSLSAIRERDTRIGPRLPMLQTRSIASLSYRNSFGPVNLFADLSWRRFGATSNVTGFVGISVPLGNRAIASATYQHDRVGGEQLTASFDRPAIVPGDVGYGLQVQAGRAELLRGNVAWQDRWGRIEAQAETINGTAASRLSARGALVFAAGQFFPVKDSEGGMVLVETGGVAGIELSRENQPVAKSGARGRILMTDLIPRTPMRIGIVPDSLPLGAIADRQSVTVAVPGAAVTRLDLGIKVYRPHLIRLLDLQGQPFAPGTRVQSLPSGRETFVGFDSVVEINDAGGDQRLVVLLDDGCICHAELAADLAHAATPQTDPAAERLNTIIRCHGRVRTFPIAANEGEEADR